jgi:hypothetical protein
MAEDLVDTGTELPLTAAPDDDVPRMLREAGRVLATLANRTKAARLGRARIKAAPSRPASRPQLDFAELLKIKSVSEPSKPTQAELAASLDQLVWNQAAPFSTVTLEEDEARRVQVQNEQLTARNQRHEEQRAALVRPDKESPCWR